MLWGCGGKGPSAWRPSSFIGLREQQSWMGPGCDGELENEGNRGISHVFLSTSPPEHLESNQCCSGERFGQGVGVEM